MPHYKGRHNPKTIERHFPHFVEVAIPPGGLGRRLDGGKDAAHHSNSRIIRGELSVSDTGGLSEI
jgi:hypothetical protein